jgi:hypothetical protein
MEFVDHDQCRLRDTHTESNPDRKSGDNTDPDSDPNSISNGHTSDPDTYATHTNADLKSWDNTYATATHTNTHPKSGDNTYATAAHTVADPNSGGNTKPNAISDADTNTHCRGAGGQPIDEDERSDRR